MMPTLATRMVAIMETVHIHLLTAMIMISVQQMPVQAELVPTQILFATTAFPVQQTSVSQVRVNTARLFAMITAHALPISAQVELVRILLLLVMMRMHVHRMLAILHRAAYSR